MRVKAAGLVLGRELLLRRVGDLAEAHRLGQEALGDATKLLRLRVGRLDSLVQDEVRGQVPQHRAAATGIAVELPT
jgi:hypothetical protein